MRRFRTVLTTVGAAVVLTALAVPAQAAVRTGGDGPPSAQDQVHGSSDGGHLVSRVVSLSGNGSPGAAGSSGGGGSASSVSISQPVPCYWSVMDFMTGQWFFDNDGDPEQREQQNNQGNAHGYADFGYPPQSAIEAHKDDTEGHWANLSVDDMGKAGTQCMDAAFAANGGQMLVWVAAGQQPPQAPPPPPDPALLRQVAEDNLTIPEPVLGRNPAQRTLVDVPTWFWAQDGASPADGLVPVSITASAGGNSATVRAEPGSFDVSSAGGDTSCAAQQGRTPWQPGASDASGCTLAFQHASVGQPGQAYPVTATASYATSWEGFVGGTRVAGGPLGTVSRAGRADVPVAEVQALVGAAR